MYIHGRVDDERVIPCFDARFENDDRECWICFCESTCDYEAGGSSYIVISGSEQFDLRIF